MYIQFLLAGYAWSVRLASPKITLLLPRLLVYIFVRPHLSRMQYITSRTLLPCDLASVDFRQLIFVATMSSLAKLRVQDGYRQAEATSVTTWGWPRAETLASRSTYRVAIQQRIAARRALEWIGASKARLVFRYEISDLLAIDIYRHI